jgi:hypothetical protein
MTYVRIPSDVEQKLEQWRKSEGLPSLDDDYAKRIEHAQKYRRDVNVYSFYI